MAHIPDGLLSWPVLAAGAGVTVALSARALRSVDDAAIPGAAVLGAMFFAGSMLAIPVGPSAVHPMFGALMGLMLGSLTLPVVLVALVLQLALFGFGGVTTLGVNAMNIALPGILVGAALRRPVGRGTVRRAAALAGCGAALAVAMTGALVALSLALSHSAFVPAAAVMLATYGPLALVEAVVTAAAVTALRHAMPDLWLARARGV